MISVMLVLLLLLYLNFLSNAFTILAIAGLVVSVLMKFKNILNKAVLYYIAFFILGIFTFIYYRSPYFSLMYRGFIGYGVFLVVMFAGVLPNKWGVTRVLKKNRGTLSIIGFIAISPHALLHVFGLFGTIDLFGIAAYVLMVPLTIISFRIIRKEIPVKDWFTIQKAAYLIYVLLFVHLLMVSAWENKIVYAVLLTLYVNNKLMKEYRRR